MATGKLVTVDTYKYIEEALAEGRPTLAQVDAERAGRLTFGAVLFDYLRDVNPRMWETLAPDTYFHTPLFALPERVGSANDGPCTCHGYPIFDCPGEPFEIGGNREWSRAGRPDDADFGLSDDGSDDVGMHAGAIVVEYAGFEVE